MSKKKKTVKISDINKEIAEEMVEERKAKEIKKGIEKATSKVNTTDEAINSLMNISVILDKRIDMVKDNIKSLEARVDKVCKRLGI